MMDGIHHIPRFAVITACTSLPLLSGVGDMLNEYIVIGSDEVPIILLLVRLIMKVKLLC